MSENIMNIEFERPKINPAHFVAIIGGAVINAFIVGGVYVSINRDIADISQKQIDLSLRIDGEASDRKDLLRGYQDSLNSMQKDISQIQPLTFQTTRALETASENKKGIEAANSRIDHVVESFGGKLDNVIDTINKVSTQVQVLSSKLDDAQGKSDKTMFRMPVVRP